MIRRFVLGLAGVAWSAILLGGFNVWTTNDPVRYYGAHVIADPLHPGTLYVGYGDGGIVDNELYKSTDDGGTWVLLGTSIGTVRPLATAPPTTVYAGDYFCGEATCNAGVSASPDGGTTWNGIHGDSAANYFPYQLVVDPVTSTTLFLAVNKGPNPSNVYRSTDAGATWTEADSGLGLDTGLGPGSQATFSTIIGTSVSGTLYVATLAGSAPNSPHGFFKTVDAGATWAQLPGAPSDIVALAADPTNPSIIYAGTSSGVYKSVDAGATFSPMSTGLTALSVSSFAINPVQPTEVFVGTTTGGVFQSGDGGSTWQPMNTGLTNLGVLTLAINSNGESLHAGTFVGVFDYQFPLSSCSPDAHTLCLNNGRFSVTADFQATPEGPSSPATAVPLTSDTGYFWFFDPANIELVTKVLNGCATNDHYWFFAGGLTNVGVQIKVKDTFAGVEQNYSNPLGTPFPPIQDTAAFSCP